MPDDQDIWVRLGPAWSSDPEQRWAIAGNAHTHRGRFVVVPSRTGDRPATVDMRDLVDASPAARIWLDGFLAGQEAELHEYLGVGDPSEATREEIERWARWNRRLREGGWAPTLQWIPPAEDVPDDLGSPDPWVYAGERYLVWHRGSWRLGEPQPSDPPDHGGWWPGTVCERRRHHSMVVHRALTVCEDCHQVSC